MFLLRPPNLLRRGPFFEMKNVCNFQEIGVRTRCAAIVNHPAVLKILRVVNLLRVLFLVRRGPLGTLPEFTVRSSLKSPWRITAPCNLYITAPKINCPKQRCCNDLVLGLMLSDPRRLPFLSWARLWDWCGTGMHSRSILWLADLPVFPTSLCLSLAVEFSGLSLPWTSSELGCDRPEILCQRRNEICIGGSVAYVLGAQLCTQQAQIFLPQKLATNFVAGKTEYCHFPAMTKRTKFDVSF